MKDASGRDLAIGDKVIWFPSRSRKKPEAGVVCRKKTDETLIGFGPNIGKTNTKVSIYVKFGQAVNRWGGTYETVRRLSRPDRLVIVP